MTNVATAYDTTQKVYYPKVPATALAKGLAMRLACSGVLPWWSVSAVSRRESMLKLLSDMPQADVPCRKLDRGVACTTAARYFSCSALDVALSDETANISSVCKANTVKPPYYVHTSNRKISLYLLTRSLYLTWFELNNEVHQYRKGPKFSVFINEIYLLKRDQDLSKRFYCITLLRSK
jgi:hypothetical protein